MATNGLIGTPINGEATTNPVGAEDLISTGGPSAAGSDLKEITDSPFNFDRLLDDRTGKGKAPDVPTDDRFNGELTLGDQTVKVEGGEAFYKGKVYKVGQDGSIFDAGMKMIGRAVDGVIKPLESISDVSSIIGGRNLGPFSGNQATKLFDRGGDTGQFQGRDPSKKAASRANPEGDRVTGSLEEIQALFERKEFDLIGGQVKEEKDAMKRSAIKKLLNFFKSDSGGSDVFN